VAEPVSFGDILLIALPTHAPRGHEQEGARPAVVVGLPELAGEPRFPTVLVVPLTTQEGTWSRKAAGLYPCLPAGAGGLPHPSAGPARSTAQYRCSASVKYLGSLAAEEFQPIDDGLKKIFGFTAKLS
jgi:mRNA interferase MazF